MPVLNLRPVSVGTYNMTISTFGAGTKWEAVDPGPDPIVHTDGSGIAWGSGTSGFIDSFNLQDLPGSATQVDSVTMTARVANTDVSPTTLVVFTRLSGVNSGIQNISKAAGSGLTNETKTADRPGGGTFSVADVNGLEIAIYNTSDPSVSAVICTSYWATVEYKVAGGDFAYLILSMLPGMIGAGLSILDFTRMLSMIRRRHLTVFTVNEITQAFAELKAHKYRRIFA